MWLWIQLILLMFLGLTALSMIYTAVYLGIGPTPSSRKARHAITQWIHKNFPQSATVLELGGGWGDLIFPIAQQAPHLRIVAYEYSWIPWLWMKIRQRRASSSNILLLNRDFRDEDLSVHAPIDVVTCYLFTGAMEALKQQLRRDVKPGTWVISNTFSMLGWTPIETLILNDLYKTRIYIYRVPHEHLEDSTLANGDT